MSGAYKCDGCGTLFERNFPSWSGYMKLPNGREVRLHLLINGRSGGSEWEAELDICRDCLAKVFSGYYNIIMKELIQEKPICVGLEK